MLLWGGNLSATVPPNERALKLEALKKEFPAHVAGKVTKKSDPAIQACYEKYSSLVAGANEDNLPGDIIRLRQMIDGDLVQIPYQLGNSPALTAASRHALTQNVRWLQERMVPYLHRLETFQKGN